jgi:hypothetical protein
LPLECGRCGTSHNPAPATMYWKVERRATHLADGKKGLRTWERAKQLLVGQNVSAHFLIVRTVLHPKKGG